MSWAGILGDTVIGPLFSDGNLNDERYLEILHMGMEPRIIHGDENERDVDGDLALDEYLLHFNRNGALLPLRGHSGKLPA